MDQSSSLAVPHHVQFNFQPRSSHKAPQIFFSIEAHPFPKLRPNHITQHSHFFSDMAFSWTNPLGALPPIPSHPVAPSDLSSTISNYTTFAAAEDQADRLLELFGSPAHEDDQKVVTLLRTFRRYLPKEGQRALNTDIIAISRDDVKLRDLARHIREAVLKPSKSPTPAICLTGQLSS